MCGDFKAKIGEQAPIWRHALVVRNNNGSAPPTLSANGLQAANARHKCHARHKYTWKSFDGNRRNEIDYILVGNRANVGRIQMQTMVPKDGERMVPIETEIAQEIQESYTVRLKAK